MPCTYFVSNPFREMNPQEAYCLNQVLIVVSTRVPYRRIEFQAKSRANGIIGNNYSGTFAICSTGRLRKWTMPAGTRLNASSLTSTTSFFR
jgi:hypothetical protein